MQPYKCEVFNGDIEDDDAIGKILEDCDAIIYLIALIREFPQDGLTNEKLQFKGTEKVIKIAKDKGIKRFLLMSALGANPHPESSKYMQAKYLSEQAVKNSKLDWTIFRPSSLFGDPRGCGRPEFCMMLDKLMLSLLPSVSYTNLTLPTKRIV